VTDRRAGRRARRAGHYRDLVIVAHIVDDTWAAMDTVGISDELGA
jgi:hypothetical protein